MAWKMIHYKTYKINKSGTVIRMKNGPGTRPGRMLKPYRPKGGQWYVKLYRDGMPRQVTVDTLIARAFVC